MSDEPADEPATNLIADPAINSKAERRIWLPNRRWFIIAGVLLAVAVGVFGGGFATGWIASNHLVTEIPSGVAPTATPGPSFNAYSASVLMPDVRGMKPDDAKQVLADAGIDVATVSVTSRASAGTSGLVIAQVPAFGASAPARVSLVVSSPATVPNVVGGDTASVIIVLTALGAQVQRVSIYVPGAPVGKVTQIEPAAGSPLPELVTLTVTTAPSSVNLATINPAGDCEEADTATADGTDFKDAVTCTSSPDGDSGSWALNQLVGTVTGTLGIADSEDGNSSATVQILADGKVLGTFAVAYGTPTNFTLNTPGVTQLTVTSVSSSGSGPEVVIGNFTALGSSANIATLKSP
jgi:hypothetical protein